MWRHNGQTSRPPTARNHTTSGTRLGEGRRRLIDPREGVVLSRSECGTIWRGEAGRRRREARFFAERPLGLGAVPDVA